MGWPEEGRWYVDQGRGPRIVAMPIQLLVSRVAVAFAAELDCVGVKTEFCRVVESGIDVNGSLDSEVELGIDVDGATSIGVATHINTVLSPDSLWFQISSGCSTSSAYFTAKPSGSASRATSLVSLNFWTRFERSEGVTSDWVGMRWIVYVYLVSGLDAIGWFGGLVELVVGIW